jgi:hypothetical protein
VLGFILSSTAFAKVVFQENFEIQDHIPPGTRVDDQQTQCDDSNYEPNRVLKGQWVEHGGCRCHSFKVVQDPCSESIDNRVVQIANEMGKDNRVCKDKVWSKHVSENPLAFKHRTELKPHDNNPNDDIDALAKPDEDFWVGMRTFIPISYPSGDDLINFHVTQIIPATEAKGTDMSLQINKRGKWVFSIRTTPTEAEERNDHHEFFGPIERGKWTNWVFHYKRSTSKNGMAQVWKDGERVANYKGVTSQNNVLKGLWKFGLYRGELVEPEHFGEKYIIYFDDVKIAKGPQQFRAVRPDMATSQCLERPEPL